MSGPFRKPEEIAAEAESTEQLCGAPKQSTAAWIKKTADEEGCSRSHLVGRILDDYVKWAKAQGKGGKGER